MTRLLNLHQESLYLQGARDMLMALMERGKIDFNILTTKYNVAYGKSKGRHNFYSKQFPEGGSPLGESNKSFQGIIVSARCKGYADGVDGKRQDRLRMV